MSDGKPIKVALISASYPPKVGPGATRMGAFAAGIHKKGHIPVIFTSDILEGETVARWERLKDHTDQDVNPRSKFSGRGNPKGQSLFEKFINLIVPMEPSWTLSGSRLKSLFETSFKNDLPDLIMTTSHPLASAVMGRNLKRKFNVPLIVELRDPWTQNPARNWPSWFHFQVESWLERKVLRSADAIIMNTPTARVNLLQKYKGLNENVVHVISHGYDGEKIKSEQETTSDVSSDKFTIAYAGGFYGSQAALKGRQKLSRQKLSLASILGRVKSALSYNINGRGKSVGGSTPETVLTAIARYNTERDINSPEINMHFIGGNPTQVRPFLDELGLAHEVVHFHPSVSPDAVRSVLRKHDMLFLTNPAILNSPFVGTKTFEYMAVGRPILVELPECDQTRLVSSANAGWICDPGDVEAMVNVFKANIGKKGERGVVFAPNELYIDLFRRQNQVDDLLKIIEQVVDNGPKTPILSQGYVQMEAGQE